MCASVLLLPLCSPRRAWGNGHPHIFLNASSDEETLQPHVVPGLHHSCVSPMHWLMARLLMFCGEIAWGWGGSVKHTVC